MTEFRDYLACPYRYYLRHRLRLEALADSAAELDGAGFGNLLHDVLDAFGMAEAAESNDPDVIRHELFAALGKLRAEQFDKPLPAVGVQIEMLRMRLEKFAEHQARWRAEGWRIMATEKQFREREAPLLVDDRPVYLHGRIDRIDHNEHTGEWAVLDYKSSDTFRLPDEVHRGGPAADKRWIDLQLPLYRHLVRAMDLPETVRLGYVLLPKSVDNVGFQLAEWSLDELKQADEVARDVVRGIRAGRFWPPADSGSDKFPEFAAICQDDVFAIAADSADAGEEEA